MWACESKRSRNVQEWTRTSKDRESEWGTSGSAEFWLETLPKHAFRRTEMPLSSKEVATQDYMSCHLTFASQIANFASHIKLSPSKVRFCTEIFGFAHFCNLCSKNGTFCCEFESPSWLPFRSRPESRKFPPQTPSKMPLRRTEMPLSSKEVATQDLFIVEANFCLSEAKFEFAFKTFASETLLWWKIYAWNCFCSLISENGTVWQHFDICICWSKKLALLSDFQLFSPLLLAFSK